jgi:hypothetical protein
MPIEPPYITHNNASLVSQDAWNVVYNPSGGYWVLDHYFADTSWEVRIEYAVVTSPTGLFHDIAVTSVKPFKTIVGQFPPNPIKCRINVTVKNNGFFTETFNLTLYAVTMPPSTAIDTVTVSNLLSGETRTVTFTWWTRLSVFWPKGNYTIWAYATPVLGETNWADNTFTDGHIFLSFAGDVDGSKRVEMADMWLIQTHYGGKPGNSKWVPNYDVDDNDIIEMADMWLTQKNFGNHW